MYRITFALALAVLLPFSSFSQKAFSVDSLSLYLMEGINKYRLENKLDTFSRHEILTSAAENHAIYMAKSEKAELTQSKKKYKTTGSRVTAFGGTKNAEELVFAQSVEKGKSSMSPKQAAEAILTKWKSGKKERALILNGNFVYASAGASVDAKGKKAYISFVLGSFNTFNTGANKRKELPVPYTKKAKKLKSFDEKACKNCDKFKDFAGLQQGVYVENNKVYLKYDNIKAFNKLMKGPKDGFAVDIVQRAQYEKDDYNIYDNNLVCKGVLLKRVYSPKFAKKNRAEADKKGKKNKMDLLLGTIPSKINGDYEINLLVIQNNKVCKTLMRSYVEQNEQASSTPLEMIPMPESVGQTPSYEPKSESSVLNFTVPFEKNKYDYKPGDVEPFLKALNEPDFIVSSIFIYAYSSIEGDSIANAQLQRKRGESILTAFKSKQAPSAKIAANVVTKDSWNLFKMSMEGGKYDYLAKMPKKEAIKTINNKGLANELEPFLSKQRFAEIVMDVTYDIAGPKEEKFCIHQFNKAVKKGDVKQAYKIQEYIAKSIKSKKYAEESWKALEIPKDAKFSGLHMNRIYHRYVNNGKVITEEDQAELKQLGTVDAGNPFLTFNNLFCSVRLDSTVGDKGVIETTQKKIDALYSTNVPKKNIDALNIEYQFKVMDAVDTIAGGDVIIQACIDRIKTFYNIKDASWQNTLKLSYEFIRFKDYKFAADLLEPFIKEEKVDKQLLFTYISACAQMPERIKTSAFVTAMSKAKQADPVRYCKLFGAPFLTFQVLDNPFVKAEYVKSKCPANSGN